MKYEIAILIHSWFSWITARSITSKIDSTGNNTLYIFSRGFDPESDQTSKVSKTLRFEAYESACNYQPSLNADVDIYSILGLSINDSIGELILPHIYYYPFMRLAESSLFRTVSFYQESIQLPPGTLAEREAIMLQDPNAKTTLFTTGCARLIEKLTMKYYNLQEPYVPLHLNSIILEDPIQAIKAYIKPLHTTTTHLYDYAIIAGKSMNSPDGLQLIANLVDCISFYLPGSSILFKASPSTSREVVMHARKLSQSNKSLTFKSGEESIERDLVNGSINILVTEMFSLAALFLMSHSDKSRIISLEATLVRDYNSISSTLTERMQIKRYRAYALSFQSLSQHLLAKLATI